MRKFAYKILSLSIFIIMSFHCYGAEMDSNLVSDKVNTIINPYLKEHGVPGAAVAVHYQGHDYLLTYGYADREAKRPVRLDTIFDLASITKVFTTTLLAIEIQKDKVKLDDSIVKYLPQLAATSKLPVDQIRVVNLATHTASLPRDVTDLGIPKNSDPKLMQALIQWKAPYPIGSTYLYSNISFGLLGEVLEHATGHSYINLLNDELLLPLNMHHTAVNFTGEQVSTLATGYNRKGMRASKFMPSYLYGGGALRSTITDMLSFLKANLEVGAVTQFPNLLNAIKQTHQPYFSINPNSSLGLGWHRIRKQGTLYLSKNGGNIGFSTFIGFSPSDKLGVVVLMNKSKVNASRLGYQLLTELHETNKGD